MREGIDAITGLIADIALRPKLSFEEVSFILFFLSMTERNFYDAQ